MNQKLLLDNLEVAVYCPRCSPLVKLHVKTNRHNDTQFLGCPNWPLCEHTQPVPEHIRMELAGQPRLFDN